MMQRRVEFIIAFLLGCSIGGIACNDDADSADTYAQAREDCMARINGFRATLDLPPLERWTDGESCADSEARSDAMTNTAHGAFGQCDEWAQNECPGWDSVESVISGCLQMMWDEGPGEPYSEHGHYINMTSTSYTRVACGFYETGTGTVWAVQNFR
ncbi:MAG: hypothetical protein JXX29_09280 [Deltaproteobacteria bacterium]|nr:hypothetical protein [Deltaproteobacteria bacterium]MBN2671855.1 hypothetical protein [Deltaproteobacteria bacterium]